MVQNTFNYLNPKTHLVKEAVCKQIPALARRIDADLVVMGNTAKSILNQKDCFLLAVKPLGLKTPVILDD
ncbi:hypothetical protein CXF80_00140 [Shewanella sp. Actino-trap-3]|uniref:hypothetical protein n=1 Tax=Shewanella sp. Actino-trap-3 TaxID=2058331 RepID=UPI000C327367|nr:hypothetical protein [Shewanella sp. Actino-trap-3]PKG76878.1 hypothetical protein CXF80_00140 [Shewanella sp. Actino-trap-3]